MQGFAGPTGAQGPAGAQGPQGGTGPQGSTGPAPTQVAALGVNTTAGPTGTVRATSNITAFFSDRRLKTIEKLVDEPLNRLDKLRAVYYEQNDLARRFGYQSTARHVGYLAQEVQDALPEAVAPAPFDSNKYGHSISGEKYLTVMYSKIVPLLVQSLKEQKEQIEYIKSKL